MEMKHRTAGSKVFLCTAAFLAAVGVVGVGMASAVGVTVPSTANPYLAGMPAGAVAIYGDSVPLDSPVLVPGTLPAAGTALTFTGVTGSVSYNAGTPSDPPDGFPGFWFQHNSQPTGSPATPENGIADLVAPADSLVGVFLGNDQPNLTGAPTGLDFSGLGAAHFQEVGTTNFLTLSPGLKQPFFIGDGFANGTTIQQFIVPAGATRLYLAAMDVFSWHDNTGSFSVQVNVAPEPTSLGLLGAGILGLLTSRRFAHRARN